MGYQTVVNFEKDMVVSQMKKIEVILNKVIVNNYLPQWKAGR